MNLTESQLHILRHSLGLQEDGLDHKRRARYRNFYRNFYRNYYAVYVNDAETIEDLRQLVEAGLMFVGKKFNDPPNEMRAYHVTDAGILEAIRGVREPKLTRSQRRYQKFLELDFGITFKEFLKSPELYSDC